MNLYVVCLGLCELFSLFTKRKLVSFFILATEYFPLGDFPWRTNPVTHFQTLQASCIYITRGVHAIKVWRYCFPSLCPLPAWPAVRLCSSIPAHFTLCVVSEKIGTFYQLGFFNLLPNYFGIAWMAMWEIVISKHKAYKT